MKGLTPESPQYPWGVCSLLGLLGRQLGGQWIHAVVAIIITSNSSEVQSALTQVSRDSAVGAGARAHPLSCNHWDLYLVIMILFKKHRLPHMSPKKPGSTGLCPNHASPFSWQDYAVESMAAPLALRGPLAYVSRALGQHAFR